MDERASSMLGMGNSLLHQAEATRRTINNNIGNIKQQTQNSLQDLRGQRTTDKEEDLGMDTKDTFTMIGDARRMIDSVGRAKALAKGKAMVQAQEQVLQQGGTGADIDRAVANASGEVGKLGTFKQFVSPSFQSSEASKTYGELAERVGQIGEEGEATTKAASGIPRIISKVAEVAGESGKSAAAIGDVVGHGLGVAVAGVDIAKDIAGAYSTMDTQQKTGNILGIAGGLVDAVSMAVPIFTPLAVGLNVVSAYENYEGDEAKPEFEKTKKGGLMDQQTQKIAQQEKVVKDDAPVSVASTGQVAGSTQSVRPQSSGVAVF